MNVIAGAALLIVVFLFANAQIVSAVDTACVTSADERERIRTLMFVALDQALQNHIIHLFEVWTKDKTLESARASAGMNVALKAYGIAHASAVKFNPPLCR